MATDYPTPLYLYLQPEDVIYFEVSDEEITRYPMANRPIYWHFLLLEEKTFVRYRVIDFSGNVVTLDVVRNSESAIKLAMMEKHLSPNICLNNIMGKEDAK